MRLPRLESDNVLRDPISGFVAALVDRTIGVLPMLEPFRPVAETIARFAGVGGASSVLYALVVTVAVSTLRLNHDLAALLGFVVVMPFNFIMHRSFTFRSIGLVRDDLLRYGVMQVVNVGLALGTMALSVDGLSLPYGVGILGAIVLIPVVTYFVMNQWVFKQKTT